MQQAVFTLVDPKNSAVTSTARLRDRSELPTNLQSGDVLRLQVESSSPRHAILEVPTDIGFVSTPDDTRPVAILVIDALGFFHSKTNKFMCRPHAFEFILEISRVYRLATTSNSRGVSLAARLFGVFDLLFVAEENNLGHHVSTNDLDNTNAFYSR